MIAGLVMGGIQSAMGIAQMLSADKPDDTTYQIPDEVFEAERIMAERSRKGLPGKDLMADNMGSAFASNMGSVKEVSSGGNLIGATADMYGDLLKGVRDIDIMDAQFRDTALVDYAGAKLQTAQYQDRVYDENVRIPQEKEYNEYINQRNAGAENFFSGMSGMSKVFMSNSMDDYLDDLYGDGGEQAEKEKKKAERKKRRSESGTYFG